MSGTNSSQQFKTILLNCNSLINSDRRINLSVFLKTHNPDALLLNETKLNIKHKINFKGYKMYRTDRPMSKNGGGTAILIKTNIKHSIVTMPFKLKSIESTVLRVFLENGSTLLLVSAYHSVNRSLNSGFLETADLDRIFNLPTITKDTSLIFGGDLNAKHTLWLNDIKDVNADGKTLADWYLSSTMTHGIKIECPIKPTRTCRTTKTYLDLFFVTNNIKVVYKTGFAHFLKNLDYESDHTAVELVIQTDRIAQAQLLKVPNFKNVDWNNFNHHLNSKIVPINIPTERNMSKTEIDDTISSLNIAIEKNIDEHIPFTTVNQDMPLIIPQTTLDLIKARNKLRRSWQRNDYNQSDGRTISQIKCLNKIISELIRIHRNKSWSDKLKGISLDNNVYKNIKMVTGYKARKDLPALLKDNNYCDDPEVKSNILADQFQKANRNNIDTGNQSTSERIETLINMEFLPDPTPLCQFPISNNHPFPNWRLCHNSEITNDPHIDTINCFNYNAPILTNNNQKSLYFLECSKLKEYIRSRNNKKSSGFDRIPNFLLKKIGPVMLNKLCILFNQMYNIGYYPHIWKKAIVVAILKAGKDPSNPNSYRPISLLSCISKIYELFIHDKILEHCNDAHIIPDQQFGFRRHHSTVHALHTLVDNIKTNLNSKKTTIAISLDSEKAFDTVWKEGLIYKMRYIFKFHKHICQIVFNFLSNRSFQVKLDNVLSNSANIEAGVPQGSILGPLLYIIYISDLPPPPSNAVKNIIYADDILILTSTNDIKQAETTLNGYLKTINDYLSLWKIKLNLDKCEYINFKGYGKNTISRSLKSKLTKMNIKVNDVNIPKKRQIKYLGVVFTENIQFNRHIDHTLRKAHISYASLRQALRPQKHLNMQVKMLVYKQLIRPILTYGFPIWMDISSNQMERIRKFERICLRGCVNYRRRIGSYKYINNSCLLQKANINRIDRILVELGLRYLEKLPQVNNRITDSLSAYHPEYYENPNNFYFPPTRLSHLNKENKLFDSNGQLTFYHRRYDDSEGHVYCINQNI